MRNVYVFALAIALSIAGAKSQEYSINKKEEMDTNNQIIESVKDFIEGADQADVSRISSALHDQYTNVQNGYFGKPGVVVIDKQSYIDHVATGKFGGSKRQLEIISINVLGDIAMVHASMTSPVLKFESYISLVLEQSQWKVIGNFPKVELINQE